jgi:hypothetical protein
MRRYACSQNKMHSLLNMQNISGSGIRFNNANNTARKTNLHPLSPSSPPPENTVGCLSQDDGQASFSFPQASGASDFTRIPLMQPQGFGDMGSTGSGSVRPAGKSGLTTSWAGYGVNCGKAARQVLSRTILAV